MQFLKNNWIYVVWFLFYYLLALGLFMFQPQGILLVTVFYAISITIALSPLGETILRLMTNVRPLRTREEREYLEPLFREVYESALQQNPNLSRKIKIHITDAMYANAFAVGRKTIAVTRGAINTFSENELKGIIAHELGHITYGHTKALLLSVVGNSLFTFMIFITKIFLFIADVITTVCTNGSAYLFAKLGLLMSQFTFDISVIIFMGLSQIILSINSRKNEYQADNFASEIGYGEELTSALYLLQNISFEQKPSIFERLTMSHPHITKRIQKLEYTTDEMQTA